MTAAASWKAVERKARLAGNGLRPCQEAQHRGRPLPGSFQGACNQGQPPAPRAASIHRMLGPDSPSGMLCIRHYYLDRVLEPHSGFGGEPKGFGMLIGTDWKSLPW